MEGGTSDRKDAITQAPGAQDSLKAALDAATTFNNDMVKRIAEFDTLIGQMDSSRQLLDDLVKRGKSDVISTLQDALDKITSAQYAAVSDVLDAAGEPV